MIRNTMLLIAMSLGVAGAFQGPAFFIAGAVVAVTALAMRFKQPPEPIRPIQPVQPKIPTDPIDVLDNELENLNNLMNDMDTNAMDTETLAAFNKLAENRDKISQALVELARKK